jgi:hypothetical protein
LAISELGMVSAFIFAPHMASHGFAIGSGSVVPSGQIVTLPRWGEF